MNISTVYKTPYDIVSIREFLLTEASGRSTTTYRFMMNRMNMKPIIGTISQLRTWKTRFPSRDFKSESRKTIDRLPSNIKSVLTAIAKDSLLPKAVSKSTDRPITPVAIEDDWGGLVWAKPGEEWSDMSDGGDWGDDGEDDWLTDRTPFNWEDEADSDVEETVVVKKPETVEKPKPTVKIEDCKTFKPAVQDRKIGNGIAFATSKERETYRREMPSLQSAKSMKTKRVPSPPMQTPVLDRSETIKKLKSGSVQKKVLKKSKLCRHFQKTGSCRFGDKCGFAHGVKELSAPECMFKQSCLHRKCKFWHPERESKETFLRRTHRM